MSGLQSPLAALEGEVRVIGAEYPAGSLERPTYAGNILLVRLVTMDQ
ncbi:hypothetical protein ACEUZ9_003184 [Paracoccus litorisediminis]|uniref:Uncharacterized protein n=1 Tax=Paracoccus litorisediminis TaxID=2006130 RepID=A0A844HYU8_9RHOB|nr:hypothetical protein [Paracoccus litorisediminis]